MGPLAILHVVEYEKRYAMARNAGDPRVMFDGPEQYDTLSAGEMRAYGEYLAAPSGPLAVLAEGQIVTAYEDMRDLSITAGR
jgi:hypothetical protein